MNTSLSLYRWTLREFRRLPPNCKSYYIKIARSVGCAHVSRRFFPSLRVLLLLLQHFVGHASEPDAQQTVQLQEDCVQKVTWIMNKVLSMRSSVSCRCKYRNRFLPAVPGPNSQNFPASLGTINRSYYCIRFIAEVIASKPSEASSCTCTVTL